MSSCVHVRACVCVCVRVCVCRLQISNVDRAILSLMAAVQWPPTSIDMYGDVYEACHGPKPANFTLDSNRFYKRLREDQEYSSSGGSSSSRSRRRSRA